MDTTPTIEAAMKLTRLFPKRITAMSLSGCFYSFSANTAPLFPFLDRCLIRYLLTRIRAVSVPEKKADNTIRNVRIRKSVPSGMSSLKDSDSFIIIICTF